MAEKKPYSSIIDALLDDREPDWKALGLKDAKASGDEQLGRTHKYVDKSFEDDIAESASRHTPEWGPKSARRGYEARMDEKEGAAPRLGAVRSDWHKGARRDGADYSTAMGDNDSLMAEVTMSLERADPKFGENGVSKKEWTDAQAQAYVRQLLNRGTPPAKVAQQLQKLAEIELFNHQSATDYLQRNAGLIGLAYLEPNTYMDKSSPTYERTAGSKTAMGYGMDEEDWEEDDLYGPYAGAEVPPAGTQEATCGNCGHKWGPSPTADTCPKCGKRRSGGKTAANESSCIADGCGARYDMDEPETRDTKALRPFWKRYCPKHRDNGKRYEPVVEKTSAAKAAVGGRCMCGDTNCPSCGGAMGTWPPPFCPICNKPAEDCEVHFDEDGEPRPEFSEEMRAAEERYSREQADAADAEATYLAETEAMAKGYGEEMGKGRRQDWKDGYREGSAGCLRQHAAFKRAGVRVQARSVKQIAACEGCSYFGKTAAGKACNLYHLPVVASVEELTQVVNRLTPGVPQGRKHAALVQIANREDQRARPASAAGSTAIVKTADAAASNQASRSASRWADPREGGAGFSAEHVARLHEKGVPLAQVYGWAEPKFGAVAASAALRGFVQTLRRDQRGVSVVASADLAFLNSVGIRGEHYRGGEKCASCPAHLGRQAREAGQDRGAQRVDQKFAQRTPDATRTLQKEAGEKVIQKGVFRVLHEKGHSVEGIYKAAAAKFGSVQARRAAADFIERLKKFPSRRSVSESDRAFLVGKLGFRPEAVRLLDPRRRPVDQVVASVPDGAHVTYPGAKQAAGAVDGRSILREYDLDGPAQGPDIDTGGPERGDVQMGGTFKVDLE